MIIRSSGPGSDKANFADSDSDALVPFFEFRAGTKIRARGYKTFFMLNSIEHEIFPAHKC